MVPAAVAQHQQHLAELQDRRSALLVDPAQQAAAHHDLMLLEQPVGRRRAVHDGVTSGHIQPGNVPAALGVTPHLQPGVVDQQLLKTQAQCQQRRHRQRGRDLRQAQRLAAQAVAQQHIVQHKRRHPTGAVHRDPADLHRMPECAAGLRLDAPTPIVQTRQNPPVQGEPGQQSQDKGADHPHQHGAPHPAPKPPGRTALGRDQQREGHG